MNPDGSGGLRERLRRALPAAIKARDAPTVAALRSALAAIDNAEAVGSAEADAAEDAGGAGGATRPLRVEHPDVAGTVAGLGAGEVERRTLSEPEVERIVRAEVADRQAAAAAYQRSGQPERADRLRTEARVLNAHLAPPPDAPEPPPG